MSNYTVCKNKCCKVYHSGMPDFFEVICTKEPSTIQDREEITKADIAEANLIMKLHDAQSKIMDLEGEIKCHMNRIMELEDKIYHLSREAPEVEYKLGHEIEVLQQRIKELETIIYAHKINTELRTYDGGLE